MYLSWRGFILLPGLLRLDHERSAQKNRRLLDVVMLITTPNVSPKLKPSQPKHLDVRQRRT